MSLGFHALINPRSSARRVGALTLFSLAGLVIGSGVQSANAGTEGPAASGSASGSATAAATQNLEQGKELRVRLTKDTQMDLRVTHPTWRESKAVRVVNPLLPQHNIEMKLFSQVVVAAESEEALKNAVNSVGAALGSKRPGSHTYRRFLDEETVFVVEGNSVEDAVNLANELLKQPGIEWTEINHQSAVSPKAITTDPSAVFQWHKDNPAGFFAGNDHNIDLAYDRGVTGAGVVVGVLEADANSFYHVDNVGVTNIHPDLVNKIDLSLSIPTDPFNVSYSHGVSVAGLIASEGNNGIAGSGVAYGAMLASLRNGSSIDQGESFAHKLQKIDVINNSWGPVNESWPNNPTGKYLVALPDDFEIDIPQVTHSFLAASPTIGLDQGIRLGRGRKGRVFVFSAGNSNHFQGFARLMTGNAISLPGVGTSGGVISPYGYLDISGVDPAQTDGNFDGIPDVFLQDGSIDLSWRWSGHLGDRVNYNPMAAMPRTLAIGSVGESGNISGYSTTGSAVFASAYSQDSILSAEFTPDPGGGWGPAAIGRGLVTLEQADGVDTDSGAFGVDCNVDLGTTFIDPDLESCMFNGTSAAAPVAAGIIALMLEANPGLTVRDIQHIIQQTAIVKNYSATDSYWPSVVLGLGSTDPDDGNPPTPTFWSTNTGGVRHSDEYGFGIIDADAAVAAAATWSGVRPLIKLDSGVVEAGGDNPLFEDGDIEDATFQQAAIISENLETNILVPGTRNFIQMSCVRENLNVEAVEVTLTIEGDGAGDLLIALQGPRGTTSILALPRGDSNGLNGEAYTNYTFTTYKHWGELSGGVWNLIIQDFRPDEESPEGDLPADPPDPDDLGLEQVTFLGAFGLPGNPNHTDKSLVSYQISIYGTDNGNPVYEGCPAFLTGCPGDLDGNGIVNLFDFYIFINWYNSGNILADMNGDGQVSFFDIQTFIAIWQPGFCNGTGLTGGRPTGYSGANDPIIRPI